MATLQTQPVIGDVGSQEVELLISNYNDLLDVFGNLITAMKAAADPVVAAAALTAETALQNNVVKLQSQPVIPAYKRRPTL